MLRFNDFTVLILVSVKAQTYSDHNIYYLKFIQSNGFMGGFYQMFDDKLMPIFLKSISIKYT